MLGRFLKWRHARLVMQVPLLLLAVVLVVDGLLGPKLAPKNLATLLVWVHYRGLLVFALLLLGNVFCMGCPLVLPRELVRRFTKPTRRLPRWLRTKWLSMGLFGAVLFGYELFDWWGDPRATALLIVAFFAVALTVDASFRGAPFCKFVCPIGQFNFLSSMLSPSEVRAKNLDVCASCRTKDCIRGRRAPAEPAAAASRTASKASAQAVASVESAAPAARTDGVVTQRGCELALFLPRKVGNLDCTFCLDCVHACPHDNVAIELRLPGEELAEDPVRSGIGRLTRRLDLSALAVLFCFGALLNAFGMVGPVYTLQKRLAELLGTHSEALVLGIVFFVGLVLVPGLLLGGAGWLSRRLGGRADERLVPYVARFAWGFVPLGFGTWLAHYAFHLLTGLWTFVPVAQNALVRVGWPILGQPNWGRGGMEAAYVRPIEIGFLFLGLVCSAGILVRIARRERPRAALRVGAPWLAVLASVFLFACWVMTQPMEMRGTFL